MRNSEFGMKWELGVRSAELVRSAGSDEWLNAEGRGGNGPGRAKIRDVRVRGTSAVFIAACMMAVAPARADDVREVLARVREYVSWYDRELVTLIADERYVQTGGVQAGEGSAGRQASTSGGGRLLESEFGWVTVPALQDTIGVREVQRVDGQLVGGALRLRALMARPPADATSEVRDILAESATHNIGTVRRNINFPTFALAYLRDPRQPDTRWHADRSGEHVRLEFEERDRSTLVRTPHGSRTPARGRFTIDPGSGRILASELRVRIRERHAAFPRVYWMLVDFAPDPRLGLWVPVRMLERQYREGTKVPAGEDAGEATYLNYRR